MIATENLNNLDKFIFESIRDNILYFAIMIAAVIGKLKEYSKRNIFLAWSIYFVGTVTHELSHFFASLVFNGKPKMFSIFPSRVKDDTNKTVGYMLGYVTNVNLRWYNTFLISMAPLILLPISFFIYENYFFYFEESTLSYIAYIFIIVSLLFSSVPSEVDIKNVFNRNIFKNLIVPVIVIFSILNINYLNNFLG